MAPLEATTEESQTAADLMNDVEEQLRLLGCKTGTSTSASTPNTTPPPRSRAPTTGSWRSSPGWQPQSGPGSARQSPGWSPATGFRDPSVDFSSFGEDKPYLEPMPDIERQQRRNPVHWAASIGNLKALSFLIGDLRFNGVNALDQYGWTALHVAAFNGQAGAIATLLESSRFNAPDAKDKEGRTALHLAARKGHAEAARTLLSSPRFQAADEPDKTGNTALHRAAATGQGDVVRAILAASSFEACDAQTKTGSTALHYAAWNGHAAIVKELLEFSREAADGGIDSWRFHAVNAQDQEGLTALHRGAMQMHAEVVEVILRSARFTAHGARDADGKTALDHVASSRSKGAKEVSALLVQALGCQGWMAQVRASMLPQSLRNQQLLKEANNYLPLIIAGVCWVTLRALGLIQPGTLSAVFTGSVNDTDQAEL